MGKTGDNRHGALQVLHNSQDDWATFRGMMFIFPDPITLKILGQRIRGLHTRLNGYRDG